MPLGLDNPVEHHRRDLSAGKKSMVRLYILSGVVVMDRVCYPWSRIPWLPEGRGVLEQGGSPGIWWGLGVVEVSVDGLVDEMERLCVERGLVVVSPFVWMVVVGLRGGCAAPLLVLLFDVVVLFAFHLMLEVLDLALETGDLVLHHCQLSQRLLRLVFEGMI